MKVVKVNNFIVYIFIVEKIWRNLLENFVLDDV